MFQLFNKLIFKIGSIVIMRRNEVIVVTLSAVIISSIQYYNPFSIYTNSFKVR